LKGTKVLKDNESGEFVFFGSVCGARALGWTVKEFDKAAKDADKARRNAIRSAEFNHPNNKAIENLITAANNAGWNFAQRRDNGLFTQINALRAEIKSDIEKEFGTL
jgi:hypothetical protein